MVAYLERATEIREGLQSFLPGSEFGDIDEYNRKLVDLAFLKKDLVDLRSINSRDGLGVDLNKLNQVLGQVKKRQSLDRVASAINVRLGTESNFLDNIWEAQRFYAIGINGFLSRAINYGVANLEDGDIDGECHSNGRINIRFKKPTPRETLLCFAHGFLPEATQTYIHEITHRMQLLFRVEPCTELDEVQARRAEIGSVLDYHPDELADLVASTYSYENFDGDKVIFAVWAVDRLNAMGFKQIEIARLLTEVKTWNPRLLVWEEIQKIIEGNMKRLALDEVGLEECVLGYELRTAISKERAIFLTRNVLQELLQGDTGSRIK